MGLRTICGALIKGMTHQQGPIALDNCNLLICKNALHLFDENGQRTSSPFLNWVSSSVSVSLHSLFPEPHHRFFSPTDLPLWSPSVHFLQMDRSDMLQLQQHVSLAKSVRHRCNEWFVCLFFCLLSLIIFLASSWVHLSLAFVHLCVLANFGCWLYLNT